MKIKNAIFVGGLFLFLVAGFAVLVIGMSAYRPNSEDCLIEPGCSSEDGGGGGISQPGPGSLCPTGACTPGNTYCYSTTTGGHQCTCQNDGTWGPEVDCSTFNQRCSCEGMGCQCKRA